MNPFAEALALLTAGDPYVMAVVVRSLAISGSALVLATLIGLPIGAAIGLSNFRLRVPAIAIVNTGLALPPVVAGLAVYLLLSRSGPLGQWEMLFTPWAMGFAQVVLAGPYIAAVTLAALESLPPDIGLQARGLGATRLQAALLQLREVRTSLVAAVAAGFGAIISEVGAAMLVGGNILGQTRVMTTTIVLETRRGNFGVAIALGAVLLVVALLVNILLAGLGTRTRRPVLS
ncbi:MAG: ABC transporter permease [Gemmatimonadota bacterium]